MRGVNLLRTKVLITTDEVIFHAPTDDQVDPRSIMQSILVAERRFIKPALGDSVYNALINTKNILVNSINKATLETFVNEGRGGREPIVLNNGDYVNSDTYLNADQQALWNDYLHKVVAEAVWFSALPVNRSRFTATGVMKNNPESIASTEKSASVDLKDLKHLMDRGLQDRVDILLEDMHAYLCSVAYAGYTKDCGCEDRTKKTDFVFGMYDDDEDDCGCYNGRSSSSSSSSSGSTSTCLQERIIPFTGGPDILVNWTTARKNCFGAGAAFTVEILNEDNEYEVITSSAVPDSIVDTTLYTIGVGGADQTGRIIIS